MRRKNALIMASVATILVALYDILAPVAYFYATATTNVYDAGLGWTLGLTAVIFTFMMIFVWTWVDDAWDKHFHD